MRLSARHLPDAAFVGGRADPVAVRDRHPLRAIEGSGPQARYMPALDGLRALAVMAVVAYHLGLGWAGGGLLGVGIFFVLSGYLITDLLAAQWERHGRIDLGDFWQRRARRLLPALFTLLVVVVAFVTLFDRGQMAPLRGDVLAAVLYVSNWWFIFHHVSYFASFGPPTPLGHLWSLAVEEQFYLVWPLLLALGLRYVRDRRVLVVLVLALAAASIAAMARLYVPGSDPTRVYDGTDTRAFALLIGAALALVWPSASLTGRLSRRGLRLLDAVGAAGLVVVLVMVWRTTQYQPFLYRGGLALLSLAASAVIAAAAHPRSDLGRLLGLPPLRWLGVRSYGIYLWHYPVIVLTTPSGVATGSDPLRAALQVAASIALAALSWRFIEQPVRHGALARLWRQVQSREGRLALPRRRALAAGFVMATVSLVSFVGLAGIGSAKASVPGQTVTSIVPTMPPPVPNAGAVQVSLVGPVPGAVTPDAGAGGGAAPTPLGGGLPATARAHPGRGRAQGSVVAAPVCRRVSAIGDSILIDAAPYLKQAMPSMVIDAHIGRQLYQGASVVRQLRRHGELGECVVLELGTNGPFSQGEFASVVRAMGPVHRIVVINTRVPRPWQNQVNSALALAARHDRRIRLVNWYAASAGKGAYFWPDGVHLDPVGAKAYARLIVQALGLGRAG